MRGNLYDVSLGQSAQGGCVNAGRGIVRLSWMEGKTRMTSRREFLQIGIAASAWPLAAQAARAAGMPPDMEAAAGSHPVMLYKVLYDRRIAASVAFARRAEQDSVPTYAMDGDMTRFWYDDLHDRWRSGPAAVAGLTTHGALFCLERLAWDQGMRVVFRAVHTPTDSGVLRHELSGPAGVLSAAQAALGRSAWSEALAEVAMGMPTGKSEIISRRTTAPGHLELPEHAESLYSWVIAPAAEI